MKSFSEQTGKEKSTELLRWICVPAAAVLGVLALHQHLPDQHWWLMMLASGGLGS